MSDQNTNDFEGREGVSGEAPPTQPAGDAGDQPTGERPDGDGKEQATGQSKPGSADDFRESLSNLSSALDRFGHAAEARARQEWAQANRRLIGRPMKSVRVSTASYARAAKPSMRYHASSPVRRKHPPPAKQR